MSHSDAMDRFDELEAGRILGDLDAEETREWKELARTLGAERDFSLELVAAAVETEFLQQKEESLPAGLVLQLRDDASGFAVPPGKTDRVVVTPPPSVWKRMLSSSEAAWAVAAILTALLAATFLAKRPDSAPSPVIVSSPTELDPEYAKSEFLKKVTSFTTAAFGGLGDYQGMSGDVVWSDEMQEGYLTLTNLTANNPSQNQYQLWIVDPSRDEKPVDGGVFDIPAGQQTTVVPIRNPLLVRDCQAFVITLEQPGGVVVSRQEVVVALAKPS